MEVFFDKQNKKVRKSFLHSHVSNILKPIMMKEKGMIILSCSRYFGNRVFKFIDKELEKHVSK